MYESLFAPITFRGRTFRNRVFSSAHAPGYAESGEPRERYQAYHEEKAKGGIGLTIFGGSSNVSRDSGSIYGQIYLGADSIIPVFSTVLATHPSPRRRHHVSDITHGAAHQLGLRRLAAHKRTFIGARSRASLITLRVVCLRDSENRAGLCPRGETMP